MKSQQKQPNIPRVVDLLFELGTTYLEKGDLDKAIEKFRQLIELDGSNSQAYLNLSKAYILKKQFDQEAQYAFEQTLQFEPDNPVINKVLSRIYITDGKLDDQAVQVFQTVLRQDPEASERVFQKLTAMCLEQNSHTLLHKLILQTDQTSPLFHQLLTTYIKESWKRQVYNGVSSLLKQLLESGEQPFYVQVLILNMIKAGELSASESETTSEDVDVCVNYFTAKKNLDQLADVYLFLSSNRLFQKLPLKTEKEKTPSIEEYELFLSNNSLSNLLDQGLNKQGAAVNNLAEVDNEIWGKLLPWVGEPVNNKKSSTPASQEQDRTKKIFDRSNCLMLLKWDNNDVANIHKTLWGSISTISPQGEHFIAGFATKDGLLIFWENVNLLLKVATEFLKKYASSNNGEGSGNKPIKIVIHNISLSANDRSTYLFDDLEISLCALDLDHDVLREKSAADHKITGGQILITSSVKKLIEPVSSFTFTPSNITIEHPLTQERSSVYHLLLDDTLTKIRSGEIKSIGRFNILKELHPNEVFTSFKAIDSFLERLVVLKILKPGFDLMNGSLSADDHFLNAAKKIGKLSHPNIALTYEVGKEQELCFIAREYIEGDPLTVQKGDKRNIDWQKALKLCHHIANVLTYCHEKNIVHGRLKPTNIFLIDKSDIKITDFQIDNFSVPLKQAENTPLDSLTYAAPEVIENNQLNYQSDIFSLGVILYELLTDRNPFFAKNKDEVFDQILNKNPEPVKQHNSKLPDELNAIVLKALEKRPDKRYGNMKEFAEVLKKVMEMSD